MGCRHSSSSTPPNSPKLILKKNGGFKKKIFFSPTQKYTQTKSHSSKSHQAMKMFNLEQILDGHGQHLIHRFEFNSACLLFDISSTHILLLNQRQLHLININTMNIETSFVPLDHLDIQEIVWSNHLNLFLLLTTDRLYQTGCEQIQLKPIQQIQFTDQGPRKSYMTINGDDLLINRSFGDDLRRYSLSNYQQLPTPHVHREQETMSITTIQLNSNKILALAVCIGDKQMFDLIHLPTDQFLHRIKLDFNENLSCPIDLHFHGYWFAKTCIPYVNIGHCLIAPDGQITRLKLFTNQDNFIRSLRVNAEKKWLLIGRQHALELYSLTNSVLFS